MNIEEQKISQRKADLRYQLNQVRDQQVNCKKHMQSLELEEVALINKLYDLVPKVNEGE